MMGSTSLGRGLFLALVFAVSAPAVDASVGKPAKGQYYGVPENCERLECPTYEVVHSQGEFEIRKYRSALWMSTPPLSSSSYKDAAARGFYIIFGYIQGKNNKGTKIDMTAPVLVDVMPSAGPFCNSSFTVHFYLPKEYQQGPPISDQARPTRLPAHRYAAVRRFGGFIDDTNIAPQVSALRSSLEGTPWERKQGGSRGPGGYSVAGYNSPFEYAGRVNEVMMWFD